MMAFCLSGQAYVKSLQIYPSEDKLGLPVVNNSKKNNKLVIAFDVLSKNMPDMKIVFRFCNRHWVPYEDISFRNNGFNTDHSLNFDYLPNTVTEAKYHFNGSYPSEEVSFPYSGKWIFEIVNTFDENIVYEYGSFYVVEEIIENIKPSISKRMLQGANAYPSEMNRIFDLRINFNLPTGMEYNRFVQLEIVENRKIESPIVLDRDNTTNHRYYEWNGFDEFTFIADDIRPGNEYRFLNLTNRTVHQYPDTKAHFGGYDQSRLHKKGRPDMNGGMMVADYEDDYSRYLNVLFEFKPLEKLEHSVYITGAFSNWRLFPEYRMKLEGDTYKANLQIKRGEYDYQYVLVEEENNKILTEDWQILEGNFWETTNEYYIFVVYNSPEKANYDKIVGFSKILSR